MCSCSCSTTVLSLTSDPPPPSALTSLATVAVSGAAPIYSVAAANPPAPTPLVPPSSLLTHPIGTPSESSSAGLLLSPASEVIPKKLVEKIRSGRFTEMKELLQDNISLATQLEELQGPSSLQVIGAARPRLREISSLPTWCYCFLGYAAAMTSDPRTRDQLAYARLIIRQAQSQGGCSFLDYDRAFRQQMASDPSMRWNALNPSLLASTSLGSRSTGARTFCTLCRAVDHTRTQCALAFLEPAQAHSSPAFYQRGPNQGVPRNPQSAPVCFSWNRGPCPYGSKCRFRHVCSKCAAASHKAPECQQTVTAPPAANLPSSRGPLRA